MATIWYSGEFGGDGSVMSSIFDPLLKNLVLLNLDKEANKQVVAKHWSTVASKGWVGLDKLCLSQSLETHVIERGEYSDLGQKANKLNRSMENIHLVVK